MPPVKNEEVSTPSNADVLAKLAEVMDKLASRPDTASEQMKSINDTIANTLATLANQFAAQNARSVMPSNAQNLDGRSYFRPKGHLHPDYETLKFHRQPWHNGHRITLEELSPDEIAVWNELSQLLPNATSRRTARDGKWKCWVGENNHDIYISVPTKSIEDQMNAPATHAFIIREFIDGKSIDPAVLYAELTALKAQLETAISQQVPR